MAIGIIIYFIVILLIIYLSIRLAEITIQIIKRKKEKPLIIAIYSAALLFIILNS